jgi:hypothetical protein
MNCEEIVPNNHFVLCHSTNLVLLLFHIKLEFPVDLFFALAAAIGMFIALVLIVNTAIRKQELTLVEYAHEGRQLEDGARVAICGTIHSSGLAPLKSPFTQKDCVAYSYKVYSKQGEDEITEYSGCRLIPSMITSTQRSVSLLGWPNLKNFKQQLESDTVLDNAYRYLRSTSFKTYQVSDLKKAWSDVIGLVTRDDGSVRDDTRVSPGARWKAEDAAELIIDLDGRRFEEQCVPIGERVCVIGAWSAEKQGVAQDGMKSGKDLLLIRGHQEEAAAMLRKEMVRSLLGGVILGVAVNVIVLVALMNIR